MVHFWLPETKPCRIKCFPRICDHRPLKYCQRHEHGVVRFCSCCGRTNAVSVRAIADNALCRSATVFASAFLRREQPLFSGTRTGREFRPHDVVVFMRALSSTAEPLFVTDLCAGDWRLRAGAISRGARTGRAAWHLDRRPTGRGDAMRVSDLYSRLEGEKARTPARHRRYLATVLDFS